MPGLKTGTVLTWPVILKPQINESRREREATRKSEVEG